MDAHLTQLTRPDRTGWTAPWLAWLDVAMHREILRLRARYELSMDELRGLYVTDEQVDRLVRREAPSPDVLVGLDALDEQWRQLLAEATVDASPLAQVARGFGLGEPALMSVLVCLAPEIELSYQSIYAYLNDDVSCRLPTVDLCARLAGSAVEPNDPLIAHGLVEAMRLDTAPLWRSAGLVLAEPLRRFLLDPLPPKPDQEPAIRRPGLVILESRASADALLAARQLTDHDNQELVLLDASVPEPDRRLRHGLLSALLRSGTLFVTERDLAATSEHIGATATIRMLVDSAAPVLLEARPDEVAAMPLQYVDHQRLVVDEPDAGVRRGLWSLGLSDHCVVAAPDDIAAVADLFALGPTQIAAASASVAREPRPDRATLIRCARERAADGFEGLVERVDAAYTWDDLVVPAGTAARLRELAAAIELRRQVFGDWGLGRLVGGHTSVRALFAGPSGTGKTMSAAVVARELGLELHRVDLSVMVSKYVGETEKHLAKVFRVAEQSAAVLFFDEADALFGKRTEVKDAHDRYANIGTSYLLQRMESFDGVVILATNLAGNLDEAFSRRIQFHIEFPMPDVALREELWRKALPDAAPVGQDVDPEFLAGMFSMTGGDVRAASLVAAFLAARDGEPITMRHLVTALARQRRQQGKVPSASEFKSYLRLVLDEDG